MGTGNIWIDALCVIGVFIVALGTLRLGGLVNGVMTLLVAAVVCLFAFPLGSIAMLGIAIGVGLFYFVFILCWPLVLLVALVVALFYCFWIALAIAAVVSVLLGIFLAVGLYREEKMADRMEVIRAKYRAKRAE